MSRYLITHHGCTCRDQTPGDVVDPLGVALWLWGRNVSHHTVYEGECPYRFLVGDVDVIRATLVRFPYREVRHLHILPLGIPVRMLWERLWSEHGADTLVCQIGGARA